MAARNERVSGALALYGIVLLEAESVPLAPQTQVIALRDLGAVVTAHSYETAPVSESDVAPYRAVIETVFSQVPILPAPLGVVFRSQDALLRWLELHYHALADALAYVHDRLAARVHVLRKVGGPAAFSDADDADMAALAAESLRAIRAAATAQAALAEPPREGLVMSAAYLVERDRWAAFVAAVAAEGQRRPSLRFAQSGPWPPYDFVRMQFGA
ncbi:MAG: hypothetical protein NVS1B4_10500 [Gemmatimonadaceae bacterium]